jgi:hypothetical protein
LAALRGAHAVGQRFEERARDARAVGIEQRDALREDRFDRGLAADAACGGRQEGARLLEAAQVEARAEPHARDVLDAARVGVLDRGDVGSRFENAFGVEQAGRELVIAARRAHRDDERRIGVAAVGRDAQLERLLDGDRIGQSFRAPVDDQRDRPVLDPDHSGSTSTAAL